MKVELPPEVLEMLEEYRPAQQREGDLTVSIIKERMGVTRWTAEEMLKKMEEDGRVERIEKAILLSGGWGTLWRPIS